MGQFANFLRIMNSFTSSEADADGKAFVTLGFGGDDLDPG
jgi:hypothetical protein